MTWRGDGSETSARPPELVWETKPAETPARFKLRVLFAGWRMCSMPCLTTTAAKQALFVAFAHAGLEEGFVHLCSLWYLDIFGLHCASRYFAVLRVERWHRYRSDCCSCKVGRSERSHLLTHLKPCGHLQPKETPPQGILTEKRLGELLANPSLG